MGNEDFLNSGTIHESPDAGKVKKLLLYLLLFLQPVYFSPLQDRVNQESGD